jgi:hypothetical protein
MRLASLICPRCRTPYQVAVDKDATTARCPFCGQNNLLPSTAERITGRCALCARPIDDHGFVEGLLAPCA